MNPNATPSQLAKFVNQLGTYNRELESQIERWAKATRLFPFATAGLTMWRNGINAWTGTGPKPVNGAAKKSAYWLAQMLSGGAAGLIALWALSYKAYKKKWPWEDSEARLLQIPLNEADRNSKPARVLFGPDPTKTAYINFAFFSPLVSRGSRGLGIAGAFDTRRLGGTTGQQMEYAQRDIYNSILHPFTTGPLVRAPFTFLTGNEPSITSLRDITGRFGPQFFPATIKAAPGVPTLGRRAEEALLNINPFAKAMAGAFGIGEKGEQNEHRQANRWARMLTDIVAPRLIGSAVDVVGAKQRIAKEAKASTPKTDQGKANKLPDDVRLELHKREIIPSTPPHKEGESAVEYEARTKAGNEETATRIRALVTSEAFKSSDEAQKRDALKEVIKASRQDASTAPKGESGEESGLRVRVKSEIDQAFLTMEQHPDYRSWPNDAQGEKMRKTAKVLLDLSFKRYQLSAEEKRMEPDERSERSKIKLQMLDEDSHTDTLKEFIERAVERAQRRAAA